MDQRTAFLSGTIRLTFPVTSNAIPNGHCSFFIENDEEVKLFEEPTAFIYDDYAHPAGSDTGNTILSIADSLKSWFEYCQAVDLYWKDAWRDNRRNYKSAYQLAISPKTHRKYSENTIRLRMENISKFYSYCAEKGFYTGDLGFKHDVSPKHISEAISDQDKGHSRENTKSRDRDLAYRRDSGKINPIRNSDLRKIIKMAGPRSTENIDKNILSRDRVIVDIGWATGLRVKEIQRLNINQFKSIRPDPEMPLVDFNIEITGKRGYTYYVAFPSWLVEDIKNYIKTERSLAVAKGNEEKDKNTCQLFLASHLSTNSGRPLSKRRIQQIFEEICIKADVVHSISLTDPDTGTLSEKTVALHSIHDLRHTCACLIYWAEIASGNPMPWKKIQMQLGHRSLQTTLNIYMKHVELFGSLERKYDLRESIGA